MSCLTANRSADLPQPYDLLFVRPTAFCKGACSSYAERGGDGGDVGESGVESRLTHKCWIVEDAYLFVHIIKKTAAVKFEVGYSYPPT